MPDRVPDPDREARLIKSLNSQDEYEIRRAIQALGRLQSGWAVEKLTSIIQGLHEELALAAADALKEIPGGRSAFALTAGFSSSLPRTRAWCAYTIGEMSLFGRRADSLLLTNYLIPLVHDADPQVCREAVHALGKIGGSTAVSTLIDVLRSPSTSAELKAYALGSTRWWNDQEEISAFVDNSALIIRDYPDSLREEVRLLLGSAPSKIVSLITQPRPQSPLHKPNGDNKALAVLPRTSHSVRILLLAANPIKTPVLELGAEVEAIRNHLRGTTFGWQAEILPWGSVTRGKLVTYLMDLRPAVVHFSGHGDPDGEIALLDDEGKAEQASPRELAQLLHVLKGQIRCVVLNTCYSAVQAEAIADEIECVIGMKQSVNDDVAIKFAGKFYEALGSGQSIRTAFEVGCFTIGYPDVGSDEGPRLLAKGKTNPEDIYLFGSR